MKPSESIEKLKPIWQLSIINSVNFDETYREIEKAHSKEGRVFYDYLMYFKERDADIIFAPLI